MLCLTTWGGVPREFWPCIRRFSSIFYARILCEFWEVGPRHFYISRPQRYRCGQISRIFQVNIDIWTIRMSLVTTGLRACSLYGQRESMRVIYLQSSIYRCVLKGSLLPWFVSEKSDTPKPSKTHYVLIIFASFLAILRASYSHVPTGPWHSVFCAGGGNDQEIKLTTTSNIQFSCSKTRYTRHVEPKQIGFAKKITVPLMGHFWDLNLRFWALRWSFFSAIRHGQIKPAMVFHVSERWTSRTIWRYIFNLIIFYTYSSSVSICMYIYTSIAKTDRTGSIYHCFSIEFYVYLLFWILLGQLNGFVLFGDFLHMIILK